MGIIHQEEVVEIAAHFLGRVHGGINLELSPFREGGENIRQHICLNLGGNIQLCADSLLLRSHLKKLPHVGVHVLLHLPERLVENAHLILGLNLLHLGENRTLRDRTLPFRLHQLGRRICQSPDRRRQCPGGSFYHNRGDNACNHNHENHELTHKAGQIPHDVVHLDIHAHIAGRFSGGCPEGIVDAHEPAEFLIADQGTHRFSSYHLLGIVGKCPFIVGFVIPERNRALRRVGIHHVPDFLFLRLHDIQVLDAAVLLDFAQLLEGLFISFVLLAGLKPHVNPVRIQLCSGKGCDIHAEFFIVQKHLIPVVGVSKRKQYHTRDQNDARHQHGDFLAQREPYSLIIFHHAFLTVVSQEC